MATPSVPLTTVRVLAPFSVSHDGTAYLPDAVAEVPASVAENWLTNGWVADASNRDGTVVVKALASIQDADTDAPHGGFTAVLSTPSTDRDGDQLAARRVDHAST